jgi:mannose-6-phosphate isomerase-like protein (cupin superfamily)
MKAPFDFSLPEVLPPASVNRNVAANWKMGEGPRDYVAYRDFGIKALTNGRLKLDVEEFVKPTKAGTGWHFHTSSEFFFCVGGRAQLDVAGKGTFFLKPGDAMTYEVDTAHNAHSFESYSDFTLWFGADFETVPIDPPAAFS